MRKRFGLSHSSSVREALNAESESPRPRSIFRTLSKRDKEQHLKKHSKHASQDFDSSENESSRRPPSRDHNSLGNFKNSSVTSVNSTSLRTPTSLTSLFRTSTPPPPVEPKRRRKRRSSLSDLTAHQQFKPVLASNLSPALDPYDSTGDPSDIESMPSLPGPRHESSSLRSNRSAAGSSLQARRNTTVAVPRPSANSLMPPPPRVSVPDLISRPIPSPLCSMSTY